MPSSPKPTIPAAAIWRQLPLPLPLPETPRAAAVDFLPAPSNAEALAWLERPAEWPQRRCALWGEEGCGKTHLLHRWAARNGAALFMGRSLPEDPGPLPQQPIAIDGADAAPELALLHLLNGAAEAGQPVLLAGRAPPAQWPVALPDLASRLRAVTAVRIGPAEDSLLRALLAKMLVERQLAVPEPVQEWLLARLPRTPGALREAAARLDRTSLGAGAPITIGLARRALPELTEPLPPSSEPPALL